MAQLNHNVGLHRGIGRRCQTSLFEFEENVGRNGSETAQCASERCPHVKSPPLAELRILARGPNDRYSATMSEALSILAKDRGKPPLVTLDTNCFIDAVAPNSHVSDAMREIMAAAEEERIVLSVSLHSLDELEKANQRHPDGALALAMGVFRIPYYPIGTIDELLGSIKGLAGSFDDMRSNDALQHRLVSLANAGADLRDRGALIDAHRAGAVAFVTSDRQLCDPNPASRVHAALGIRILTPDNLVMELQGATVVASERKESQVLSA